MSDFEFYRGKYESITLESILVGCKDFDEFERVCSDDLRMADRRVGVYLAKLLDKYDKKASVVSVETGRSSSYVGNIINGINNNPSRDLLISICLYIGANVEETQYLLKYAGHAPLYVRKKRDVIVWFGLTKGEDLDTVNENLTRRGLSPLYKEKDKDTEREKQK